MLEWIRTKFGGVVIGGIITFIAFVFVFYGVFNPKSTRGLGDGAVAGTVNGDPISISEFNREYNRRVEFFKNLSGGKFSEEQLKAFRIRDGVFQELVRRKLMAQEADKQGLYASDEEIKEKIQEIPAFQKEGKFDLGTYRAVLQANSYSPATFERLMREDLSQAQWQIFFKNRVQVSKDEIQTQFAISQNKRNLKYVLLTLDSVEKTIPVDEKEVAKTLADPSKINVLKAQYDGKKELEFKGKTFDDVKSQLARKYIAGSNFDQVRKISDEVATQIVSNLTADKNSDAKIKALLKPYNGEAKLSGPISEASPYVPGIGEAKELMKDAFAKKSPIDPLQGGKPKVYHMASGTLVALVAESTPADFSKMDQERDGLIKQISARKERDMMEEWVKKLQAKAKVDPNPAVIGGNEAGG